MKARALFKAALFLAFFCSSFAFSPQIRAADQTTTPFGQPPAHPSILVPNPDYDFGSAPQGDKVEHAFTVLNTGNAMLRIENIRVA